MKFSAVIYVMPRPEILDPQGKATLLGLQNLGLQGMEEVRIGKRIELTLEAADEATAQAQVENACRKLLANTVIEQFSVELKALTEA